MGVRQGVEWGWGVTHLVEVAIGLLTRGQRGVEQLLFQVGQSVVTVHQLKSKVIHP